MTNEEAIRVFGRMLNEFCNEDTWMQECKDAVDMAIEALKAQQLKHDQNSTSKQPDLETLGIKTGETCEDAISRQAAIDVVRRCSVKEVAPAYMLIDKAEVMTELMMLPSAQPERKKGKWIIKKDEKTDMTYGECSSCSMKNYAGRTNFCPNCGADMRGEQDEL